MMLRSLLNPVFEKVTADSVSTDDAYIANVGTRVTLSADQTIPANSYTKVELDQVSVDDTGSFDTTNNEFVVPDDGIYSIVATVLWDNTVESGTQVRTQVFLNGNQEGGAIYTTPISDYITTSAQNLFRLSAGDSVDIRVTHDSSTDETVFGESGGKWTDMIVVKLG
jgi:hypothetical protein